MRARGSRAPVALLPAPAALLALVALPALVALLALAALLPLAGCGSTGAPRHLLAPAREEAGQPWGAWIEVRLPAGDRAGLPAGDRAGRPGSGSASGEFRAPAWAGGGSLDGEFLAVDRDSLYVLHGDTSGARLLGLPLTLIERARIVYYDPQPEQASGLAAAGALTSLSHGFGFIFSGPIWLLAGTAMHGARNHEAIASWPRLDWPELRRYARYPQGPPPGLRRLDLRARPPRPHTKTLAERNEADRRGEFGP